MTRDLLSKHKKEKREFLFKWLEIEISCKIIAIARNTSSVTIELLEDMQVFKKGERLVIHAWELKIKE